jgi:hypothetical protein
MKESKPGRLALNFAAKAAVIREPRLSAMIAKGYIFALSNSRVLMCARREGGRGREGARREQEKGGLGSENATGVD